MQRRYYINYPRDFANEYTVYVVSADAADRLEAAFPGAEEIPHAKAVERGITRPRQARRDGEQWYGGLCNYGPADATNGTTRERLEAAERNTLAALEQAEGERELADMSEDD
jgi:hypothetical protein